MEIQKRINSIFSISRVFAILSVISAHVGFDEPIYCRKLMSTLGSIGVIIFFILAGYFFRTEKYNDLFEMLKDKAKKVGIPWGIMGTIAFMANAISNASLRITDLVLWLIGYKTYLYYIPILFICYIAFYKRNYTSILVSMILTIISIYATAIGLLQNVIINMHMTNYLNVFNWVGFFALGSYLQTVNCEKLYRFIRSSMFWSFPLFIVVFAMIIFTEVNVGYFSYIGIPFELLATLACFGLSSVFTLDNWLFHTISNMTYSIYLVNLPLIWTLKKVLPLNIGVKLIFPVIVLATASTIFYISYTLSKHIKLDKVFICLTGAKLNRNID